jgi:hypothetical protein
MRRNRGAQQQRIACLVARLRAFVSEFPFHHIVMLFDQKQPN